MTSQRKGRIEVNRFYGHWIVNIDTYRVDEYNDAVHVLLVGSGVPNRERCEPSAVRGYPRVS